MLKVIALIASIALFMFAINLIFIFLGENKIGKYDEHLVVYYGIGTFLGFILLACTIGGIFCL